MGANKEYIEKEIPHGLFCNLCGTVDEVDRNPAMSIVISNKSAEFDDVVSKSVANQTIIDLVRINEKAPRGAGNYFGICW